MWVSNESLKKEFKNCLKEDKLTNKFASQALTICRACLNSERFSNLSLEMKEDIESYFSLTLVRNWHKLQVEGNLKYCLQTMSGWSALEIIRKEKKLTERKNELINLAESFRSIRINSTNKV